MGCTDRESNFQRMTFDGSKWWASSGYTPSFESERLGPLFDQLGSKIALWKIVHDKTINKWVATPKTER